MNNQKLLNISYYRAMLLPGAALLLSSILPFNSMAQGLLSVNGEMATCQISVSTNEIANTQPNRANAKSNAKSTAIIKKYKPNLNQIGYFDQVSNIQAKQKVPVEVSYPNGRAGDKVVIAVADGGTLDNKERVRVVQLDSQKKLSFIFQAADDPGIYRIVLRKGIDTKVVQLWVGAEPVPVIR